jgi:hypothetical protein
MPQSLPAHPEFATAEVELVTSNTMSGYLRRG